MTLIPSLALMLTLAQAPDAPLASAAPSAFSISGLSRDQLWGLRLELEGSKPGLAAPVVLLAGGGFVAAGAVALALACGLKYECGRAQGFDSQGKYQEDFTGRALAFVGTGVLFVAGAALVTWGFIKLLDRLTERRLVSLKLQAVEEQLDLLRAVPAPAN